VTQKVAAVEDYEQIVLLMEGEVLASGTHPHLMATSRNMSRSMTPAEHQPLRTTTRSVARESGGTGRKATLGAALKRLVPLMADEKRNVATAVAAMLASSLSGLLGPVIIASRRRQRRQPRKLPRCAAMGRDSARDLPGRPRRELRADPDKWGASGGKCCTNCATRFSQAAAAAGRFLHQNKAGDLISRINNDTDKLNVFFAQSLMQFASNLFFMTGAAIFILTLNVRLGLAALAPAVGVLVVTRLSPPGSSTRTSRACSRSAA